MQVKNREVYVSKKSGKKITVTSHFGHVAFVRDYGSRGTKTVRALFVDSIRRKYQKVN